MAEFANLEDANLALQAEEEEWRKAGLSMAALQLGAPAPMLLEMSTRLQALTNVLILKGLMTDDEINLQFKNILYNNMVALRESAPEQTKQQIRERILQTAAMGIGGMKMPWEK